MPMPTDVGVIDLMLGIPSGDPKRWYDFLRTQLLDRESREDFEFPAQYMFKHVPQFQEHMDDPVSYLLSEMDKHGIEPGDGRHELQERPGARRRSRTTPTASSASFEVDPNRGMEGVRELEAAVDGRSASRRPPRSRPG